MQKLNILILEDESIIALYIKNSINILGHNVVDIVKDASSALTSIQNNKIDIALVDININGDLDGIQAANIINKTHNIPIIFLTAYKDMQTLKRALKIEFVGYIVKPFRDDELETMINIAIVKYDLYKEDQKFKIDDKYSYCFTSNKLYNDNIHIPLTDKENKLLQLLLNAKGSTITYSTMDNIIWHDKIVIDVTRRQLFFRLKNKLQNFPFIVEKNIGYRINI